MIGARLKQARLLAGMTQAGLARRLEEWDCQVTKAAISNYEHGKRSPDAVFLLAASAALDVPPGYFMHEPQVKIEWRAFRCQKRFGKKDRQRIMAYAADIAELQIELRQLLRIESAYTLPKVKVATLEEAEAAAEKLRECWNVGDRPLDNLVQVAEDRNIMVVGWRDDTGRFDGLSGMAAADPVIVVKTNTAKDRLRMSLAHEIGHLVMDTDDEPLASRFAGALLLPAEHAYRELGRTRSRLDWGELKVLKRKYGMSMQAWVRRARDLKIISESVYKGHCIELSSKGWRKQEPVEYIGDEEPMLLEQMARRAVAKGLMGTDRINSVWPGFHYDDEDPEPESDHLTALDLLDMPEAERDAAMARAFELAADMEFERFETGEFYEYDEGWEADEETI